MVVRTIQYSKYNVPHGKHFDVLQAGRATFDSVDGEVGRKDQFAPSAHASGAATEFFLFLPPLPKIFLPSFPIPLALPLPILAAPFPVPTPTSLPAPAAPLPRSAAALLGCKVARLPAAPAVPLPRLSAPLPAPLPMSSPPLPASLPLPG